MKTPRAYILIGVPGSGKTTWMEQQDWAWTCSRISTDKWVDIYAREVERTYSEVFDFFMPTAVEIMTKEVETAREIGRDIIWDQTSTTVTSRKKKFNMLPNYEHIAVVFPIPPIDELKRRLSNRPGKIIPQRVLIQMIDGFEQPTLEEGFKEIWTAA